MSDLRKKILGAASDLFQTKGVQGVSMRRIAERVGVTPTAIYRYYEDKSHLLGEISRSGLQSLQESLGPALRADTPEDRLRGLIDAYLDFALERPEYFDLAFGVPSTLSRGIPEEILHENWMTFGLALGQIALCMERGDWRRDDPVRTAILIWSTVHGIITLHRMGRLGVDEDSFRLIYRRTVDRLLRGLEA